MPYLKLIFLVPFLILYYQLYNYATSKQGSERQKSCRNLGIASLTLGIVSLASGNLLFVSAGLILMMFGFRLIAHGLDRLDKKVFIDRYQPPPE